MAAQPVHAQTDNQPAVPEQAVEAYLERLGLKRLLAEQLEERLSQVPREDRAAIAERLGRLYVEMLSAADNAEQRQQWMSKSEALLVQVPEADSFELRLNLSKAVYGKAEEIAERHRLRTASPAEVLDAEKTLRGLVTQFTEIAGRVHRRVDQLERIEQTGEATERVSTDLAEARRLRSLAFYYAGWASTYLAFLTKAEPPAVDALRYFGWLLNSSGGRQATVDRVQPAMLQYEHVARAAIGCAMASSLRGNDTEALRWLDLLSDSDSTPKSVKEQLPARRMAILGAAKRWGDLELMVRRARKLDQAQARAQGVDVKPLPVPLARLLAVIALEADKRVAGPQIEPLAKIALADLVAQKEIGHVLDLVNRYGTAPIGDSGFIVHYVRALQAFEQARARHTALSPKEVDDPATDPEVINLYKAAADLFASAALQGDAAQFKADLPRAVLSHGRALFFAGEPKAAAEQFLKSWELAGRTPQGEEPLWLAVVAFEQAGKRPDATKQVQERLAQTIALFLQTYPDSDKSPRLVLMQAAAGTLSDDDALKVLGAVTKDSPVYEASRRQIARILYSKFRTAAGPARDFAANRFVAVAEDVLAMDRKAAMDGSGQNAQAAADRVVVRARQMLDALLGVNTPDVGRAESVLKVLSAVAVYNNIDLKPLEAELAFRRVQIALGRDDEAAADAEARAMEKSGDPSGQYIAAAERLMYRRWVQKFKPGTPDNSAVLDGVVMWGVRVIDRVGVSGSGAEKGSLREPAVQSLYSTVAGAAYDKFKATGDVAMRQLAIRLDRSLLSAQRTETTLRRLAELSESADDKAGAIECWRTLLESAAVGTPGWFEARYESLRLLATLEPGKAREALTQHRSLYPDFGPEPWGEKLRELDASLPASTSKPGGPGSDAGSSGGAPIVPRPATPDQPAPGVNP